MKKKYNCLNCRRDFEELDVLKTTYEDLYGVADEFKDKHYVEVNVCPFCGESAYVEKKVYDEEDEYFEDEDEVENE